jgi:arginyl-tRNA synthetase
MGFKRELQHLSFEFVTLEGGAMAARKGNVIRYEELRDALFSEAQHQTELRHQDWTVKQIDEVARAVSFAAMRFGMLRQDIRKKIVFNLEEALSFEGFTGPYLLYTYARIQSLLKKAGRKKLKWSATTLNNIYSHQLFLSLAKYPEVLFESGQRLQPALLSQYLFDLAKSFSEFYTNVPVLKTEGVELGERLALVQAVGGTLRNGLEVLGIEVIDEM